MTQIFTGEGLGLQGSSLGLGSYGPKGVAALGQGGESAYVNAANGNLVLRQSDGFLADIGFGIDLFQTYNSRGEGKSAWCFNVQSRVELSGTVNTKGSAVTRIGEDGHRSRFLYDTNKQCYVPEEGGTARLTFSQNGWTFREGSAKTSCHYNKDGQLIEINDLDGHSIYFNYQNNQLISIIDSSGKQKITWSFEKGLLQDVTTTSDGIVTHHLHYEYDDQQRLHKVSRDLGQGKTFWITYDYAGDSNRISAIKQSDGTCLYIEYDAQGRVKKLVDGEGRISIFDYQQGKTTVTNGLGESWTYYYDDKNRLTGIDGPEQYRIRYHYEGALLSTITQGNQVWKFSYNDEGDCIRVEEPSGQVTLRIYDSGHRVLAETKYQLFDGNHHPTKPQTTRYIYDERGHLLFAIAADGTVTERRYDEQGQLVSTRCYLRTGYDVSSMNPDTLISRQALESWIAQQNPQAISLIDYRYDWRGQLIEEIHYGQVDALGQGILTGALSTRSRYDAAGRLVEKSIPIEGGWSITQYFYDDLGRLIQTIDNQNHSQRIEYDDVHQRIIQTDANGLQTVRLYDKSGLLLSMMRMDSSHAYGSKTYKYDAAGHLIAETGIDGLTVYTFYDHQGRIQAQVNSSGQITETFYDEEGRIIKTRQYEQQVSTQGWLEQFPSFTAIKPQNSNTDRITQLVYNQYNQIAYRIDAQGAVIAYQYDAQGQVISATAYAKRLTQFNPEQTLTFDTIQLITDTKDRTTYYYYDSQGRLEAQINGEGYATYYRYDRLGNLIETCRFTNRVSKQYSGDWSQDKPANTNKDIHTYSIYDAHGLKVADIDGEGYLIEYRYDASGLLQEKCSYELAISKSIPINEGTTLEQIRPQTKNNDHHTFYQYNDLGLLIQEKTQNGLITAYTYDEMGQLLTKTLIDEQTHAARQQRYRYDLLGRVIQSLDELGAALLSKTPDLSQEQIELIWQKHSIHFEYDNSGLLLTKTNALNQSTYYFYDEARALRYTVNDDGAVMETDYNSFGQVAFTRSYSAYLKTKVKGLSTQELSQRLNRLQDDRFDEFTRYEYNTIGQMIAKYSGSHGLVTTSYNAFGELEFSTQGTGPSTKILTSFEYDKRGLLTQKIDDVAGLSRFNGIQYDAFGWVTQKVDGNLNKISYVLNKRGEQVMIFNASNQFKKIAYDAFGRVLDETDYTHSKTVKIFSYDDKNRTVTFRHVLESTEVMTQFNAFGDQVSIKDGNGFVTSFHYDEKGQLIRIDSPEQSFKEFQYDESGHLIWQQDAGGQVIKYSYDAAGHVLSKTLDPEGLKLTTSYEYDAIGRQLQVTEPNSCIKQFIYDNQGNLIQSCIDPEGLNLVTEFSYDDRGLLILQTEVNAHGPNKSTAYKWDNLGRRIATITDPDGLKLTTTYQYDDNDNLVCQTDANQHSTHYIYDVNNRCTYQINARGVVTEHVYDINGNEIQTVLYAKTIPLLSQYNETSLKSVLKTDSIHDQYQFRIFNNIGQIITAFDALGYATTYDYDKNGNLVYSRQFGIAVPIAALKEGDRSLPKSDVIREQWFVYDELNQLRFKFNSQGHISESQYDKSGQLISSTRYFETITVGDKTHYTLDQILKCLKSNSQLDQTTRYTYDKAGRVAIELSAEGIAKSYQYDNLGRVIASTQYATRVTLADLNHLDSSHLLKSTNDRTSHFVYDTAGRELYRISSEGRVLERRYDEVGNIVAELTHATPLHLSLYNEAGIKNALKAQEKQAKRTGYEYDAAGRLLTQVNAQQTKTQYSYDAEGNVLSKTEANKALWTYKYDEANQLIETKSPNTKITTSLGTEQRSIITRNTYDSFGNLIGVVRDAEGLKQTLFYEFDNNNHKIKTLYPDVRVNSSSAKASNQRQENTQTLAEEIKYNAFGEVIASSDKAGNWKHCTYDSQGLLLYSIDTQSALTSYQYNTFGILINKTRYANPLKLSKDFDYAKDAIAKIIQINEDDRQESYTYNLDNQVIEVTRDSALMYNPRTDHYDRSIKPTTKTVYNAFGEVIKTSVKIDENNWADTYTYYDKDGHQTAVIDAEGYLTTYQYTAFGDVESMTEFALAAHDWSLDHYSPVQASTQDRTVSYTYDTLGQLTSKTLKQVRFERLKAGTNTYETLTKDLTTTYSYDALGHLTSTTDAKGNTAYCYYDELGQLIAKIAPQTQDGRAATTYSYDALGHLIETRKWAQGALEANETQFKLKGASGEDIVTRQEYDNQGQLITQTDGLKHQTYYSYDANGNLARSWQTLKQADGSAIIQDKRYTYDSEKHLLQTATFKKNGTLHTDDAQYNAFGEVIAKGNNGQLNTHVEYDRLGRVWRSNTQGYYQIFVYDLMDHVTQVVTSTNFSCEKYEKHGIDLSLAYFKYEVSYDQGSWRLDLQRQNNTYNALGHLLSQKKEYCVAIQSQSNSEHLEYATQSQTVDRWGNMLTFTNALEKQTRYEYNAFNQVIKQELPEVKVVDEHGVGQILKTGNKYAYDELGQAIAMVDALVNGHTSSKEYDALGRVILERDAKENTRTKHYNLLEQLTSSTNELKGVTSYTYDQANRLISVTTPKTNQHYEYDEAGQLIKQINGAKETTSFGYDSLGNQVTRTDANGHNTYYEYDDAGHKTKETDAEGRSQSWVYDENGRVKKHTDLGNHTTSYGYNINGMLMDEKSTAGKYIKYEYRGDGELTQYADITHNEIINYTYDVAGQMLSKESEKDTSKNLWINETDSYQYDDLGRLLQVRRRLPEDTDKKGRILLAIDYDYDAYGNIRHTHVNANYTGHEQSQSDDYYFYDETNRMTVNKGQLVNGQIKMTSAQGSTMTYDAAGNIQTAAKYEGGAEQNYRYSYNNDNQLDLIQKNNKSIQAKFYDLAGRVKQEDGFDERGALAQRNIMSFDKGLLAAQSTYNGSGIEVSKSTYEHDKVSNLKTLKTHFNSQGRSAAYNITHEYSYELWDGYQQQLDKATSDQGGKVTTGKSTRNYDANGQLKEAIDNEGTNTTYYLNSGVEGIKARKDKDGQTSYLSVAGKTIGDLRIDDYGKQKLTVYGGFTPSGSQQKAEPTSAFMWQRSPKTRTTNDFLNRAPGDIADGTLPDAPQDNLGAYTLQAGDTLERVALQVYGDSSLWYLLADANGITDRNAQAGNNGQLHIGQRINIPPVATGQHQTNGTHKVLNANQMIGNTSATTANPVPPAPPPLPKNHNGFFSKIVVAIIAVVATVMTAGIIGALAGVAQAGAGLFATGMSVLGGGVMATTTGTLAAGFTAGFVSSIASQGAAKALGLQEGVDLKNALVQGLATAATGGLLRGLNNSTAYNGLVESVDHLSISKTFSISNAAQLMEQNALSQGINLSLTKHQHFDWEQLAIAGATAGLMGGTIGKQLDQTLRTVDHNTGILISELKSLVNAGAETATTGSHFDATQVLSDNLGSAIGSGIIDKGIEKNLARLKLKQIDGDPDDYCPIPTEEGAYSPIPEGTYQRFHEEAAEHRLTARALELDQGSGASGYDSLIFDSDLFKSNDRKLDSFESKVYWNSAEHGVKQFVDASNTRLDKLSLTFEEDNDKIGVWKIGLKDLSNKTQFPLVVPISDAEFTDTGSLSLIQIREIIGTHNPNLLKDKYNADITLYKAAQEYKINPKVLLATLQQEQTWGLNGREDKIMGIGPEGRPQKMGARDAISEAARIYRRWFEVGVKNLQKINPEALKLNDIKGTSFDYIPRTGGEYSKFKYTPWTYNKDQRSRPYDQWVTAFRSF
jgi:YD repeat-containing protein